MQEATVRDRPDELSGTFLVFRFRTQCLRTTRAWRPSVVDVGPYEDGSAPTVGVHAFSTLGRFEDSKRERHVQLALDEMGSVTVAR